MPPPPLTTKDRINLQSAAAESAEQTSRIEIRIFFHVWRRVSLISLSSLCPALFPHSFLWNQSLAQGPFVYDVHKIIVFLHLFSNWHNLSSVMRTSRLSVDVIWEYLLSPSLWRSLISNYSSSSVKPALIIFAFVPSSLVLMRWQSPLSRSVSRSVRWLFRTPNSWQKCLMGLFALLFLWRWGEIFGWRGNGIIDFYGVKEGGFCMVRPSRLHATASLHSASFYGDLLQRWEKVFVRGLVKFVPAVAYHFCLSLQRTWVPSSRQSLY